MTEKEKEAKTYLPISQELHPVGTRLLVRLLNPYQGRGYEPTLHEAEVVEWSPGGRVKLRFEDPDEANGYGSWHNRVNVEVVENLEPESLWHHDIVRGWYKCRP
jgi:hypothetical protein